MSGGVTVGGPDCDGQRKHFGRDWSTGQMHRELGMPVLGAAAALVLLRLFTCPGVLHVCEFPEAPRLRLSVSVTTCTHSGCPLGQLLPTCFRQEILSSGEILLRRAIKETHKELSGGLCDECHASGLEGGPRLLSPQLPFPRHLPWGTGKPSVPTGPSL